MKEVAPGLFAVEETMPCLPSQIRLMRWALPGTLDRIEREVAAARILSFSKELDQWVGVSWRRLDEMMRKEYELQKRIVEARNHNLDEEERIQRELKIYNWMCFFTLGLYRRFHTAPKANLMEVPGSFVVSGVYMHGQNFVVTGIHELVELGFLKLVTAGEGENASEVIFPTPSLIERIMQRQGEMATS